MKNQIKKTIFSILICILIFSFFIDFWNYKIININPFSIVELEDYQEVHILSLTKQFILYVAFFYTIYVMYSIWRDIYLIEIDFLYKIIKVALYIYTILSYLFIPAEIERAMLGTLVLFLLKIQIDIIKAETIERKLLDMVNRRNVYYIVLFFCIIILVNIWYIFIPKSDMYVYYEHEDRHKMYRYDIVEDNVISEKTFDLNSSGSFFNGGGASKITAKTSGEYIICFSRLEDGIENKIVSDKVVVDQKLKFHFGLDMEYIILFYPLNCFIIVWSMIYIFLLLRYKLIKNINRKQPASSV